MRTAPCELKAVLHLFSHDEELRSKALPHVDVETQSIDWNAIFKHHYGSGHYGAILWAYAIWRDTQGPYEPFQTAFAMDAGLRRAALRALAIRWCIPIDGMSNLGVIDHVG